MPYSERVLLAILLHQGTSGKELIASAIRRLNLARTVSVTQIQTTEEFPKARRTRLWFQKGGYFRSEADEIVDIGNPRKGWTYDKSKHIFQLRPAPPASFQAADAIGISDLAGFPVIGTTEAKTWHKRNTLRVELDGTRMTKETKLYVFLDAKTKLPVGISANLGSITQVRLLEDLRLDPKLDAKLFQFSPPKGWKQVSDQWR
jgi:outer membrane lipoprotein-sorting protein